MKRNIALSLSVITALGCASASPAPDAPPVQAAPAALDRSIPPVAAPEPDFQPPPIQRATLSNGLTVMVAENHELPIAGFYLTLGAGSSVEPQGKEGLANLTAALLDRGAGDMDALELSDAFKRIGANQGTDASLDDAHVVVTTLVKHQDKALELMAKLVLEPTFPEAELERLRSQILNQILQKKDDPSAVSSKLFYKLIYGDVYYGRPSIGTETSVKGITRSDVVEFYKSTYSPSNAVLIVAGDVSLDKILPSLEAAFGAWANVEVAAPSIELPAAPDATVVYLNDKPGAAQSQIRVGTIGIARKDPRFYSAQVFNQVLGGSFQSRINLNLREDKGYTYGARSTFRAGVAPGPFLVGTGVRTDVTAESLNEIMSELRGIQGDKPITEKELSYFKDGLTRRFPGAFESTSNLMVLLAGLAVNDLPDDTLTTYVSEIRGQTLESVAKAGDLIDPDAMLVMIVGDRAAVEKPLIDAGYKVVIVDDEGMPVDSP